MVILASDQLKVSLGLSLEKYGISEHSTQASTSISEDYYSHRYEPNNPGGGDLRLSLNHPERAEKQTANSSVLSGLNKRILDSAIGNTGSTLTNRSRAGDW